MATEMEARAITRQHPHLSERKALFLDPRRGTANNAIRVSNGYSVVYLTGEAQPVGWWHEPLQHGARLSQWYNALDRRTGVYVLADGTERRELRMAASWFNQETAKDAGTQQAAWGVLGAQLRARFGQDAIRMSTPAMTGRALFAMAFPRDYSVSPIGLSERNFLYKHASQGRIQHPGEYLTEPHGDIPGLYQLDARWMYAACCSHLPVGPLVYDRKDEYSPHIPGFYEASVTVPDDWSHIGLLPFKPEDGSKATYPNQPGQFFDTFATGAEIELALDRGWKVQIHSRWLWPLTHQLPDVAGVDTHSHGWLANLKAIRAWADDMTHFTGDPTVAALVRDAIRHIHLDTIGSWFSHDTERHGVLPLARISELPKNIMPPHLDGQYITYSWREPLTPDMERWAHPEWSATVWGRCRARTAREALAMPYSAIAGIRTDAILLTKDPHYFGDKGRPGDWRMKAWTPGPLAWPQDEQALLSAMRHSVKWE